MSDDDLVNILKEILVLIKEGGYASYKGHIYQQIGEKKTYSEVKELKPNANPYDNLLMTILNQPKNRILYFKVCGKLFRKVADLLTWVRDDEYFPDLIDLSIPSVIVVNPK